MNSFFAGFIGFFIGYLVRHFDIDKAVMGAVKQKIKENKENKNVRTKKEGE